VNLTIHSNGGSGGNGDTYSKPATVVVVVAIVVVVIAKMYKNLYTRINHKHWFLNKLMCIML
jgi:hypothetical protein